MPVYLGLDCGGSTCRALALDETGEPVFLSQGGSANLTSTPEETLARSLSRALEGVPEVDFVCACFAGLIDDQQRERATRLVREHIPTAPLRLEPDYAAALRACPDRTTVCVIAGTGSIVCSRHGDQLVKSGGGGYLLGDEGSGYRYGRAALQFFLREPEEITEVLREAVSQVFDTLDPANVVQRVYRASAPASLLAHLSPALLTDAANKVPYAVRVLQEESQALAQTVTKHLLRFHPEVKAPLVGLAGGMWKRQIVRSAFSEAMASASPTATLKKSDMPPARGAALLAQEMDIR